MTHRITGCNIFFSKKVHGFLVSFSLHIGRRAVEQCRGRSLLGSLAHCLVAWHATWFSFTVSRNITRFAFFVKLFYVQEVGCCPPLSGALLIFFLWCYAVNLIAGHISNGFINSHGNKKHSHQGRGGAETPSPPVF